MMAARRLLVRHARRTFTSLAPRPDVAAGAASSSSGPLAAYNELVRSGRLHADDSQLEAAHELQQFGDSSLAGVYLWGSVGSGKSMLMDLFADACSAERQHFHELMIDVHSQLHALHMARPRRVVLSKFGLPMYKYDDPPVDTADSDATDSDSASSAERPDTPETASTNDGTPPTDDAALPSTASAHPKTSPPLEQVIRQVAARGRVLCLDEMQVTDVADAMLLRQLFEGLFDEGVKVVFTSNRPPHELYERGLNRKYFLPFVQLLNERCAVRRVGAVGGLDYRTLPQPLATEDGGAEATSPTTRTAPPGRSRVLAPRGRGVFLSGPEADMALRARWEREDSPNDDDAQGGVGDDAAGEGTYQLPVAFGRELRVRGRRGGACWFRFDELCSRTARAPALGAADYLALASSVSCVYLCDVPTLSPRTRNEARRFVMLVDALYESRVRLMASGAAPREKLLAPLLHESGDAGDALAEAAEIDVGGDAPPAAASSPQQPTFAEAPVGGRFRVDGELAGFFTAKDERYMLKRTLSRLVEMTEALDNVV